MTRSRDLSYAEMAYLKRHWGVVVRRQVAGVARIWLCDGTAADYAIEHLRYIARGEV